MKDKIKQELMERGLLKKSSDNQMNRLVNVFRKMSEPNGSDVNSSQDITTNFKKFATDMGLDVEDSVKLANLYNATYGDDLGVVKISRQSDWDNLPSEGISATDPGDYPNDATGGDAEMSSNEERERIFEQDIQKEHNTFREVGPQEMKKSTVDKVKRFRSGYASLTAKVSPSLAEAAMVLTSSKKTAKTIKLKRMIANMRESLNYLRAYNSKLVKYAADKKDDESVIKDTDEAVEMLLDTVDQAKSIEETLKQVKNLAEDVLPEDGEGMEDVEEMFEGGDEEEVEIEEEELTEEGEDVVEEEMFEEDAVEEPAPEIPEADLDAEEPPVPADEEELNDLDMMVKGFKKVKNTYETIKNIVLGTAPYLPDEQRAFDETVTDMPNESTFREPENKSNKERADKGEKNQKKELANPDLIHEPGHIQDVRDINAHHVSGKKFGDYSIIVTKAGEPVLKASYSNIAGKNASNIANFKRFASKKYLGEVVAAVKEHGIEAVRNELDGTYIKSAGLKKAWKKVIAKTDKDIMKKCLANIDKVVKKAELDTEDINEKEYFAKAYGDPAFGRELAKDIKTKAKYDKEDKDEDDKKDKDTEKEALRKENANLKRKEIMRTRANRAVKLMQVASGIMDEPLTQNEIVEAAKNITSLDDTSYDVLASVINKIAERTEPGQAGVVHNTYTGVEEGRDGSTPLASDQEGLRSEPDSDAKNPEKVVTPPDVQSSMEKKPAATGVVPQMTKNASSADGNPLTSLATYFTCTRNDLRKRGLSDAEISKMEAQYKINR